MTHWEGCNCKCRSRFSSVRALSRVNGTHPLLVETQKRTNALQNSLLVSCILAYTYQYNPAFLLLDISMREMMIHVHTVTYVWMFTNSFIQNHPRTEDSPNICALMNRWTTWSTFIYGNYLKNNGHPVHATPCINLRCVRLTGARLQSCLIGFLQYNAWGK